MIPGGSPACGGILVTDVVLLDQILVVRANLELGDNHLSQAFAPDSCAQPQRQQSKSLIFKSQEFWLGIHTGTQKQAEQKET